MPESEPSPYALVDQVNVAWQEYQYRHDLVWRTLITGTLLAASLALVPYSSADLVKTLGYVLVVPPVASVLAVVGTALVLSREARHLNVVELRHRALRTQFLELAHEPDDETKSRFLSTTPALLLFGLFLTAGNLLVIAVVWIPASLSAGQPPQM